MTTIIGLTGGIGVGKSTVTTALRKLVPVFDCDQYVANAYRNDTIVAALEGRYGPLGDDPKASMADRVWKADSNHTLTYLSAFFGGVMISGIDTWKDAVKHINKPKMGFAVLDAPTLFEAKMERVVDRVVVITAPITHRWDRVKTRPNMTQERFHRVMREQINEREAIFKADYHLENDGTLEDLERKIEELVIWCQ